MIYTRPSNGAVIRINWRFLWSYLWGWLAFASWPSDPDLWGFYILSGFSGLICWALLRSNLGRIAHHLRRDRENRKFNSHGHAPRSDRMASRFDLKHGGLLR